MCIIKFIFMQQQTTTTAIDGQVRNKLDFLQRKLLQRKELKTLGNGLTLLIIVGLGLLVIVGLGLLIIVAATKHPNTQ